MRRSVTALLAILFVAAPAWAQDGPVVFADTIFETIMNAHAEQWAGRGQARPVLVFDRSDVLRKRLADGAKADLFVSIDEELPEGAAYIAFTSVAELADIVLALAEVANAPRVD